jgi:hypothetical protein
MNKGHQRGPQGVRGDRHSGSKFSNLTPFQPFYSATAKIHAKYLSQIGKQEVPLIRIEPTHDEFLFPITANDIRTTLGSIPAQYIMDLDAVLVPSGSKKQIRSMKDHFMHGEYWQSCIFLHPYPKILMTRVYEKVPNPAVVQTYTRAGAIMVPTNRGIELSFDIASLRRYYLRDVLIHEIGHHVGGPKKAASQQSERFAKWFASEYGYRFCGRHNKPLQATAEKCGG